MADESILLSVNETARRHFEAAWQAARPEPIERHLPATDDPRFLGTLEELVQIDLEMRWKAAAKTSATLVAGVTAPLVEEYLKRFPQLNETAIVRRLLKQEFRCRQACGDQPRGEDFRARFPEHVPAATDFDTSLVTPRHAPVQSLERLPNIPGYEIIELLGRGGMGVVYKAQQTALKRLVALKMIRIGVQANHDDLARFRIEAEAAAQLQHPNVVQIHEIGESEGQPYFSLEFIPGGSLAQWLNGAPQPPRACAQLVEQLARAMHYAHSRGIVHRDLKPANVLLQIADLRLQIDDTPSKSANLQSAIPKIADFGLAKRFDADSGQTQTGAVLGTPSYMAPEQALGRKDIGPAADTYALGAILYEMLTGRPPFRGPTAYETILQVQDAEPVPPTRLQPQAPRDLETICLKCLQKDPPRRYASAEALADDLGRFLRGEPIAARPVGRVERTVKWLKRNPLRAALAAAVVLFVLGAGVVALWYQQYRVQRYYESRQLNDAIAQTLDDGEARRRELHERLSEPKKVRPLLSDLPRWRTMLNEIHASLRQAQKLADRDRDALDAEVVKRLEALDEGLKTDETDWKFVAKLEELELEYSRSGKYQGHRMTPKYMAVFAERGWDIENGDPAEIAERMAQVPIRYALVDALDFWAEPVGAGLARRLNDIARRVDPDPWRDQIRRVRAEQDLEALVKLSATTDFAAQPPRHLRFLANRIANAGGDAASVVRKALLHYPSDFWLNISAADNMPDGERTGFYRAALAARPDSGPGHVMLGYALLHAGAAEGLDHCRKGVTLAPDVGMVHTYFGYALFLTNDVGGAIAAFAEGVRLDPESADTHFALGLALKKNGDEAKADESFKRYRELHARKAKDGKLDHALDALRDGIEGKLTRMLPLDPVTFGRRRAHAVWLYADRSYQVDLNADFDTLLRIENAEQKPLLDNDDLCPPDNLNSRVVFTPPHDGAYLLVATSFKQEVSGTYRLRVGEVTWLDKPKTWDGNLTATKEMYKGKFVVRHSMRLTAGRPYVIELESAAFDVHLILAGLAENSGLPGAKRRARIDFTPAATRDYTIAVSSSTAGQTGPYKVTVKEYGVK